MDKKVAKRKIALSAARQGLKVQMRAGKTADDIRIINRTGKVVAEGTVKLDSSKKGYETADVVKVMNQISTKLNASSADELANAFGSVATSSSRRRKMNAGCHGKKKLNAEDDVDTDEYVGEDAEFVDDVESIVTDEAGNEIVVDEMLVVQNPDTNEISLFAPTEGDDQVPENVEVIGEVVSADGEEVLDSSRKLIASRKNKMNASAGSDLSEVASALATAFPRTKVTLAVIAESPEGPVTIVKNGNLYKCKAPGLSPENWDSVEEVIDFLGDNYSLG